MLECTLRGKYWLDGVYSGSEGRLVLRSDFVTQGEHSMAGAIHLESLPPAGMGTSRKKAGNYAGSGRGVKRPVIYWANAYSPPFSSALR